MMNTASYGFLEQMTNMQISVTNSVKLRGKLLM